MAKSARELKIALHHADKRGDTAEACALCRMILRLHPVSDEATIAHHYLATYQRRGPKQAPHEPTPKVGDRYRKAT